MYFHALVWFGPLKSFLVLLGERKLFLLELRMSLPVGVSSSLVAAVGEEKMAEGHLLAPLQYDEREHIHRFFFFFQI